MRTENSVRGLNSTLLAFAIVLSMTLSMTFIAPLVLAGGVNPIIPPPLPPPEIEVEPRQEFTLQFKLFWDEPEYLGYFWLGFYWDSPRTDSAGTPSENFTFVSASAYLEDNLDPISTNVTFSEGVSHENAANWRYAIVVGHDVGYPWDDNFYVDVVMRASGVGEVPHIPDNHRITIWGTIDVAESTIKSYDPPYPYVIVRVLARGGVDVSISPSYRSGILGENLTYTVIVRNKGNILDNYSLTASDNENWGPTLDSYLFENVQPGENRTTTLSVTVPENAVPEDNITVTATSQADNTVKDNDSCIARATYWTGTVVFRLENLWAVRIDKNLDLYQGSKLVVKFYTWWNEYENESVIENFTPPWHVQRIEVVPHPEKTEKINVKRARLDLTYDNTENVISTIATFTVRKTHLIKMISQIKGRWDIALPPERSVLIMEISDIKSKWSFAPS